MVLVLCSLRHYVLSCPWYPSLDSVFAQPVHTLLAHVLFIAADRVKVGLSHLFPLHLLDFQSRRVLECNGLPHFPAIV